VCDRLRVDHTLVAPLWEGYAQGTPTHSHISLSILVYEKKKPTSLLLAYCAALGQLHVWVIHAKGPRGLVEYKRLVKCVPPWRNNAHAAVERIWHIRQPEQYSGLGSQANILNNFHLFPFRSTGDLGVFLNGQNTLEAHPPPLGARDLDAARPLSCCTECSLISVFSVEGSGFRVQGVGFRVPGAGCRVPGAGFGVQGALFRVQGFPSAEGKVQKCLHLNPGDYGL